MLTHSGGAPATGTTPAAPSQVLAADGQVIKFDERGSGSTSLILVHGWTCDRTFWSEQIDVLAKVYRVIAIDLPGHGESSFGRKEWTLAEYGRDVRAVVDALALDRVVVIGHSMGGLVALEAAKTMPRRVVGIVGVDTLHNADDVFPKDEWEPLVERYENEKDACGEFVRAMFVASSKAALVKRVIGRMCAAPLRVAVPLLREIFTYDLAAAMKTVSAPIRVINAATSPTNVEGNRKYTTSFEALIMKDVGHFLMIERSKEFNEHLMATIARLTGPR